MKMVLESYQYILTHSRKKYVGISKEKNIAVPKILNLCINNFLKYSLMSIIKPNV